MSEEHVLRLRCRKDLTDRCEPEKHYAVDLRLPLDGPKRADLTDLLAQCCCGAEMVVLKQSRDPWIRTPGAR